MWKEFVKSLENTNVEKGISCARYWSLILEKVYEKEGIQVPEGGEVAEFSLYQFPKVVEDDENIFTSVARIPDAMLRKVHSTHKVLVRYMKTFDPAVQTGVLLEVTGESSKKKKKTQKEEKLQSSKVSQAEEVEKEEISTKTKKEIIPSKSGVLKKLRKSSQITTSSPNIRKTEVSSKGQCFAMFQLPFLLAQSAKELKRLRSI